MEVCSSSCLQRKACRGHSGSGKRTSCPGEMPGFWRAVNEGLFAVSAFCFFYSAVILGTVEFFNSNPVMHLCSYAWQYVLIFGCQLFIHPDHQLISKIRLPTFPIRPDHPTNLSRGDERLPFPSPAAICRVIYLVHIMNAQASFAHLQLKCIDGPIIQCAGQMRPPGVFWEISQGGEGCTSMERNWEMR